MKNKIIKVLAVVGIFVVVFCTAAGSANDMVPEAKPASAGAAAALSNPAVPTLSRPMAQNTQPTQSGWLHSAFAKSTAATPSSLTANLAEAATSGNETSFSEFLAERHPPDAYVYSDEEKALIARVVYAEARGEIFSGKVAVAAVVLNRFESGRFGKTVKRVVFARNQFAVAGRYNTECLAAVEAAIANRDAYPDDLYYFRVSRSKKWRNFDYYTRIGNHSFYCA